MAVGGGANGVWHCPFDGVGLAAGAGAQFPGANAAIKNYTRASAITSFSFGDSDDWGITAVVSFVTVNFTIGSSFSGSNDIEFFVETNMGSTIGHVANANYATGSYSVTIPVTPVGGEHMQILHMQVNHSLTGGSAGNEVTTITNISTDGCGPPPPPPIFWQNFVACHEIP